MAALSVLLDVGRWIAVLGHYAGRNLHRIRCGSVFFALMDTAVILQLPDQCCTTFFTRDVNKARGAKASKPRV